MTNTKWLRRALLGGVALGAMATGAQADELDALKAQLETLQARVNQLEARPAAPALPEGASMITFQRGSESMADWKTDRRVEGEMPADRGFTIAITPAADMPAPVTTVTVGGYVKGDVIYDFDQDLGDSFGYTAISDDDQTENHVRLHARQSRFNIKSKTDTAVGQLRTLIEVDFFSNTGGPQTPEPRLRHAWGEWDFLPYWTFGAGWSWRTNLPLFAGITTVDFNGPAGLIGTSREAQVRLQYKNGPWTFAAAIENPTCESRFKGQRDCAGVRSTSVTPSAAIVVLDPTGAPSNKIPDLAAKVQFDAPGGHQFHLGGAVRFFNWDAVTAADAAQETGFVVTGAANFNIMDLATLSLLATWGDGAGNYINGAPTPAAFYDGNDVTLIESLGLFAGLTVPVTDMWSFNVGFGYADADDDDISECVEAIACLNDPITKLWTLHGNVIWKPVKQLQMGWEAMYAEASRTEFVFNGPNDTDKEGAFRLQYGVWFFF